MYDLIGLDADDTLWHNEPMFVATQTRFRHLLLPYHEGDWIDQRLQATEIKNLRHFGYGIKGFVLNKSWGGATKCWPRRSSYSTGSKRRLSFWPAVAGWYS